MIATEEQLDIALKQLASFRGMREAMQLHLQETEPSLIPLMAESYERRIQELQEEICDFLLRQRHEDTADAVEAGRGGPARPLSTLPSGGTE